MNIKQAVERASARLSSVSDSPILDARLLICHACEIEQTQLIAHPEQELTLKQENFFNIFLDRRANGEPLAYITGTKEFWSLDFSVNNHVLIPRPETELLVELTLKAIANKESPQILDLGTGSGAIAISIAKEREDAKIIATDISHQALEIAKKNAEKHDTEITFILSSWYENLAIENFDAIICNPPYIAEYDLNLERHICQYEPRKALISNKDGLKDLEIVITTANNFLSSTGYLAVEHGFQQGTLVHKLFVEQNFKNVSTYKDLTGHQRVTAGNKF